MPTKPNRSFGCFTVLVLAILGISFFTSGSLNPLTIYTTGSLWVKFIITFLAVLSLPAFLQILFSFREAIVWIIFIGVLIICSSVLFDDPSQDGRVKAAYTLLDRIEILNTENEKAWGISNFEILADVRGLKINPPQTKGNEVIIPIWIRGTDNNGVSGQWKMKLNVEVEPIPAGSLAAFEPKEFSIHEIKPLSWWEQLGRWLLSSLVVPIAVLIVLYGWNFPLFEFSFGIFLFILGFLYLVGYLAYVYFGSVLAVVIGVLFWIILTIFIIAIISSQ